MNKKSDSYHLIIDHQNIEKLKKMVDEVSNEINSLIDVIYTLEGENPPALEFTEMLWDPQSKLAIVVRTLKYKAEPFGEEINDNGK